MNENGNPFGVLWRIFGDDGETLAYQAICVVYGRDKKAAFGSYVTYPSTDRRGSQVYVVVPGPAPLGNAAY